MIPYIGDLSKHDAFVLRMLAEEATSILEFGVGASTQILRHYSKGSMISVDTEMEWVNRTKKNFELVGVEGEVTFMKYEDDYSGKYDFIFVDGHKSFRKAFALQNWKHLSVDGIMAFHDTRKDFHIDYVGDLIKSFYLQIDSVGLNISGSNISCFKKQKAIEYENWNETESREKWQYGRGEFNMEEFLKYKERMTGFQYPKDTNADIL